MSSDAILVRLTLKTPPTLTGSGPFTSQTFGLSTGDTDQTGIDIVGDGATCKFWSGYISGLTWSDSLDLSQGKGGFASASDGALTLIDATANTGVSLSAAIRSGLVVIEGATVWAAAIPSGGTFTDVMPIRQFQVVGDCSVEGGDDPTVTINLRTASWLASDAMETTINKTQITTSADDSQNPTDPNYPDGAGDGLFFQTLVGRAFGGIDVSIKASSAQPVQKIARFNQTTLVHGDISSSSLPLGDSVATAGHLMGALGYNANASPSDYSKGVGIWFDCFVADPTSPTPDTTEADRLEALLDRFVANGYKIVLSDGQWFLDLESFPRWAGAYLDCGSAPGGPGYFGFSAAKPYGALGIGAGGGLDGLAGVWFNITGVDRKPMWQLGKLDPKNVCIYAVPRTFSVTEGQSMISGFVRGSTVAQISGDVTFDPSTGITAIDPAVSSSNSIVSPSPVLTTVAGKSILLLDVAGANKGAAFVDGAFLSDVTVSGSTDDLCVDPSAGWSGDETKTLNIQMKAFAASHLIVKLKASLESFDAEYFSADASYTVFVTGSTTSPSDVVWYAFKPPFFGEYDRNEPRNRFDVVVNKADRQRVNINWNSFFSTIQEMNEGSVMDLVIAQGTSYRTVRVMVTELFLWAFRTYSFSNLYPVVYPFFRRFGFEQIAASPTAVCGVDGTGSIAVGAIDSQNIAWDSASPVVTSDTGAASWTGIAYDGAGRFLAVGYLANATTTDDRMVFATSTDGGATWATSKDATFPGYAGGKVFCDGVRWVILVSGGNYIRTQTVAGYPGAWTDAVASRQFNAAKGNGSLWLVGGAVASGYNLATTTDFASLATQTIGTTEEVRSISWIPSSKTWLVGMTDGSVWYSTVATDATVPTSWTKVVVFAGNLTALGNWSGISVEAFGFDADGRVQQFGSTDGANWIERDSRPDVAIYSAAYTNPSGAGIWIGASGSNQMAQVIISDSAAINWTPWATPSPSTALQNLRSTRMGGVGAHDYNPIHWSGLRWYGGRMGKFGISFDPGSGETPSTAVAKICDEWWGFAGEFAGDVDASNDPIPEELPCVKPGDVEDVYSELTFEYHKFGDAYLKTAYVRNVDTAYTPGNDAFYFGGWDREGVSTNGLAIWNECRASFLRYGTKRELRKSFDSIHDETTMGALWTYAHPDLGPRIRHITRQPRYLYLTVQGIFGSTQAIASHRAASGCRYKPNQTMIAAQGWALPEWGIVTSVQSDSITGNIELEIMFAPE